METQILSPQIIRMQGAKEGDFDYCLDFAKSIMQSISLFLNGHVNLQNNFSNERAQVKGSSARPWTRVRVWAWFSLTFFLYNKFHIWHAEIDFNL